MTVDVAAAAGLRAVPGDGSAEELEAVAASNGRPPETGRESQATRLVALALEVVELFHDGGVAYASVPVAGHRENCAVRSRTLRTWLARKFYEAEQKAPGAQALQDALGVLEGHAVFAGPEHPVFVRIAGHEENIYLDLGNADWSAVEVTRSGWRIVADPPVRFRRPRALGSLPVPRPGGSVDELRPFVNVASEDDWHLLVAWLLAALSPSGPYPALALHGEQGTGKSTRAAMVRSLLDPNSAPLRAEPREARDLAIAASNGWVIALDNLSHVGGWLSDALCRLATGGGFATRELYSDQDETIFDSQRPIILTGIGELATRGDLLDRSLILYLERIPGSARRAERELWAAFDRARPRILGALLDAASGALRHLPSVELDELPRMADFAEWVTAAEPALGWAPGKFMDAYTANRDASNELTLEATPLAAPLRQLAELGFEGTATDLLDRLAALVEDTATRRRDWPANARSLSTALRRLAPNLREAGIEVEFGREPGGQRRRTIAIRRAACVPSVPCVRNPVPPGDHRDATRDATTPASTRSVPAQPPQDNDRDDRDARDANSASLLGEAQGAFARGMGES